jgi:hypothetical protein
MMEEKPEARDYFADLANQFAALPGCSRGQMFGLPVVKVKGKAFMSLFQEEIVLKLDRDSVIEVLALPGSHHFDPMGNGRLMKEWVQIPYEHAVLWDKQATRALNYVRELIDNGKTGSKNPNKK